MDAGAPGAGFDEMEGQEKECTYDQECDLTSHSDYFEKKNLQSNLGIDDLEEYGTEKATFDELKQQNSYFINDLIEKQNTDKNE